jgi:hypothetical protein
MALTDVLTDMETQIKATVTSAKHVTIGPVGPTVSHPAISIMPGLASVNPVAIQTEEEMDRVWWRIYNKQVDQRASMIAVIVIADSLLSLWLGRQSWGGNCIQSHPVSVEYDALVTGVSTPLVGCLIALDVETRRVVT